jgi:hypothetical protein
LFAQDVAKRARQRGLDKLQRRENEAKAAEREADLRARIKAIREVRSSLQAVP